MAALRVISAVAELLVLYIQFNKGYVDFERNVLRYFVRFFWKTTAAADATLCA